MEGLLAGCYWAVWGRKARKKSGRSGAKWVNLFSVATIELSQSYVVLCRASLPIQDGL